MFFDLQTVGAYAEGRLIGFIQFGKTAFGFDDDGKITDTVSYSVVRNFYFDKGQNDVGMALLNEAKRAFKGDRVFAFFHYFGMSCYARHGKLFEGFGETDDLLRQNGFATEHENVFYSSKIGCEAASEVKMKWHDISCGGQRYCDFLMGQEVVGGCEVHSPERESIAFLRWIFVNSKLCGKGIGSECMPALKNELLCMRITRLDTDTAVSNKIAQHFYEKNGFINHRLTRSYEGYC